MTIESRQNRVIKDIRRLRQSKGGHALLEGPHLVEEAVRDGLLLESVLATPEFLQTTEGRRLSESLPRSPLTVAAPLLASLCDADSPRGVLAVARLPRGAVESLPRTAGPYLFLDGAQDPGNLGAAIRSLEAAGGVAAALTAGSVHPNHPRALRGSAGSLLRIPVATEATEAALREHLAGLPARWVALVPRGGEDPAEVDLTGSLVLAVGAEGPGLSEELLESADVRISIPLSGRVESLNLAVATALVLFEARRQGSPGGVAPVAAPTV